MPNPFADIPQVAPTVNEPVIVEINAAMVPLVVRALNKYKYRYQWVSDVDFENGLQQINRLQEALLYGETGLREAIDRLTRYVDTAFNGTVYSVSGGVVVPPIADVPPAEPANDLGALRRRLLQTQGSTGGFLGFGGEPTTLASLLQSGRVNTPADEGVIADGIEEIVGVVAGGGSITTALTGLLGSAADVATDGGLAAVQIAAIVANAASAGALAAQLARLTAAIDGGGLIGPGGPDNNLLKYARETARDEAGENTAGENLQRIYERLGDLKDVLLAPSGSGTIAGRLDYLSTQLAALAVLDSEGNPVAGGALAAINTLLECICEGVNGTPTAPTWPAPPEAPCGSSFPTPTLRATLAGWTLNPDSGAYEAEITEWEVVDAVDGVTWVATPAGPLVSVAGSGTRQLCITHQWPEGVTPPVEPIAFNFIPYLVDGSREAARPSISYAGGLGETETFFAVEAGTDEAMGYIVATVSGAAGEEITSPARIYIFAGAFG